MVLRWMILASLLTVCSVAIGQSQAGLTANEVLRRAEQTTHDGFEHAAEFDYCMTENQGDKIKTYAVFMMYGSTYAQLVAVNGVGLPAEDLKKLASAREAEAERRSRETPEQHASRVAQYNAEQHRNRTLLREMITAFDFTLRGTAQKDGWETYVLDVKPRPGYQPKDRLSRVLTGMQGTIWIDEQNYGWVRAEAEVVRPVMIEGFLARVERGTRFAMEQRPFGRGFWLPTWFSIYTKARILFLFPTSSKKEYTFFDYVPVGTLKPEMCLPKVGPPVPATRPEQRPEH